MVSLESFVYLLGLENQIATVVIEMPEIDLTRLIPVIHVCENEMGYYSIRFTLLLLGDVAVIFKE